MKKKFPIIVVYFIIGVVFAGIISYSALHEAYRNKKIETEVENLRQEAKRIQSENDSLALKIAYFETPEFQEKVAKEKLNLQKPDEGVVVVKPAVQQEKVVEVKDGIEKNVEKEVPNYVKWLNFFFKYRTGSE